jgi:hypothetical protein
MLRSVTRADRILGLMMPAVFACTGPTPARSPELDERSTTGMVEAPADPWEGCEVERLNGSGHSLQCPSYVVSLSSVSLTYGEYTLDLVQSVIATLKLDDSGARSERLRVDDLEVPVRISDQYVIAEPRPGIGLLCHPRDEIPIGRCLAAVESVARDGLPPGVTFDLRASLYLLGHPLVIPDGCLLESADRMRCPSTGAALDWRDAGDEASTVGRMVDVMGRYLRANHRNVAQEEVACTLVDHRGEGVRFSTDDSRDPDILLCNVISEGFAASAQCLGRLPRGAPFPSPCDQVFDGIVP